MTIKNFRCYQDEISVSFDDLTTFVGKNDIGKSSVLEALEIFFNNDTVAIEQSDANIYSGDKKIYITCEFEELPDRLSLDAGAETTLANEYLLTSAGTLKLQKQFDCKAKTPSEEVFAVARHPQAEGFRDLLELKEKDLQKIIKERKLDSSLKGNPGMRKAIWESCQDLQLTDGVLLPLSKGKEDGKMIWQQLENHLPLFALFQSDRNSRDSDGEVQNPMKAAVAEAISEVKAEIEAIQIKVREKAVEIARQTHAALQTIDPGLARDLTPQFNPPAPAKWTSLFSLGLDTDDGIPLNKRGSGVRRLVLVSFFKAAAERRLAAGAQKGIIFALEEPETAQHPNNQKILIDSFKSISADQGFQVILTTHSPGFAAELPAGSIRFIRRDVHSNPEIVQGADVFGEVAAALGVVPDSRVRVLLCVEGPTDVVALKQLSKAIYAGDPSTIDLSVDERVAFVVCGGSTLQHWVSEHYLRQLHRPEVHIYDSDVAKYAQSVVEVNARQDGSWATQTRKHEIESYLHSDAIQDAFGFAMAVPDALDANGNAVPAIFAAAYAAEKGLNAPLKDSTAKKKLSEQAFQKMTLARLQERDPNGEVVGWLQRIRGMLN